MLADVSSYPGYDAHFLGRIDYYDLFQRKYLDSAMEFNWNGFWTSINSNVYWPPESFNFEEAYKNFFIHIRPDLAIKFFVQPVLLGPIMGWLRAESSHR